MIVSPFRSLVFLAALAAAPALAQPYPPASVPGGAYPPQAGAPGGASQSVRIDRLESRLRDLTGQIEQLQFQLRRMEQQMQKFQQDVDYRFQENGGGRPQPARPQRRSEATPPAGGEAGPQVVPAEPQVASAEPEATPAEPQVIPAEPPGGPAAPHGRRGDAFDPRANPDAPGAPRALAGREGAYAPPPSRTLPRGPLENEEQGPAELEDPNAPLDLTGRNRRTASAPRAIEPENGHIGVLPGVPGQSVPGQPSPGLAKPAAPPNHYRIALAALKENRYDDAEQELRIFIAENPRSRVMPDAVFNLGQTYERRGRHREAAEQYLKITQNYSKSPRASESMLRLGLALEKLGAQEQACATWHEASRKYPLAPSGVRVGLERQIKRAKC